MIKDHEEDVAQFRRESQSAKDPDIREFTSKTLPTLEEHLRLAKDTGSKVGVLSPQTKGATAQK
jgi:putative membrane protein